MKRLFFVLLIALISSVSSAVHAQTIKQAKEQYEQFLQMRVAGNSNADMYIILYRCYTNYLSILNTTTKGSVDYSDAKTGLTDIHPHLYNGAVYFNAHRDTNYETLFARAYIDITLMDAFSNSNFNHGKQYADMAYCAASNLYNNQDYKSAIKYFEAYLSSNTTQSREITYTYMANACYNIKDYKYAKAILKNGVAEYPKNFTMLAIAINCCLIDEDYDELQYYLDLALQIEPNNETLLYNQGELYERTNNYDKALKTFIKLNNLKPNVLLITEHIASNAYNLAALNFNKATLQEDAAEANTYSQRAIKYFTLAEKNLELVVANTHNSVQHLQALAVTYDCLGKTQKLENINKQLASMGAKTIAEGDIPMLISSTHTSHGNDNASSDNGTTQHKDIAQNSSTKSYDNIPTFTDYANNYVEEHIKAWMEKDTYETTDEYQARVNKKSYDAKINELIKSAEKEYIKSYVKRLHVNNMVLKPYDADHEVFLIESEYGELIISVPRAKNEAKIFENSWNGIQLKDPTYYISNDKILLSGLTFVTPTGQSYYYDGEGDLSYTDTVVNISYDDFDKSRLAQYSNNKKSQTKINKNTITVQNMVSDVDIDIPKSTLTNNKTFVLIITNEEYRHAENVEFATADGEIFKRYCINTMGIPEVNIHHLQNATLNEMKFEIEWLTNIGRAFQDEAKLILYYAGHGTPDESTQSAYLLPTDGYGSNTTTGYKLSSLYETLSSCGARATIVLLDACFSGAERNGKVMASARSVEIKVKHSAPTGNLVVLTAASGDETAWAYKEKGHGMFTYFLLKKLKETKGDVTLGKLYEYIHKNVTQMSIVINSKNQTPSAIPSQTMVNTWKNLTLY